MFNNSVINGDLMKMSQSDYIEEIDARELDYRYVDSAVTKCEMSQNETKFLIELLKRKEPKKIVEIGVSAGGSTYYFLKNKRSDADLYSVDISPRYYQDISKETGYIAKELCSPNELSRWHTFFGYDIIDCIDAIGDDIDFLFIDTVHTLPGEFLSFFAVLPNLTENAVVVLHDTHLNYMFYLGHNKKLKYDYEVNSHCNSTLMSVVSTKKKMVLANEISNIGGFYVDKFTRDCVFDLFNVLYAPWYSYPEINMDAYVEYIGEHYSMMCKKYFLACINMQKEISKRDKIYKSLRKKVGTIMMKLHFV